MPLKEKLVLGFLVFFWLYVVWTWLYEATGLTPEEQPVLSLVYMLGPLGIWWALVVMWTVQWWWRMGRESAAWDPEAVVV